MATISNIVIQIKGDNNHAKNAIKETEKATEHLGASTHGTSRAFTFLGRQIEEAGKNGMGESVAGMGELTKGVGEAIHGYHALHSVIHLATGAQAALNAITPAGWALMATGAIAAGAAYLTFSQHEETAAEKAKKLKEALGDLANKQGAEFERGVKDKTKELKKQIEEAEKSHKWEQLGMAAGPIGMAAGYLYEQHAIGAAKEELKQFNEAVKEHIKEAARKQVDSTLDSMKKEADKLNKTPLTSFIEELNKSKMSAKEGQEALQKYKEYASQIDLSKAKQSVKELREEMANAGKSKEAIEAQKLWEQYNKTHDETYAKLAREVETMDTQKKLAEDMKKQAEEYNKQQEELARKQEELVKKAKSLTESVSPFAKYKDEMKDLNELLTKGLISMSVYEAAANKMKQDLFKKFMSEAPKYQSGYTEYGTTEAANQAARDEEIRQQEQWAQTQIEKLDTQNQLTKQTNDFLSTLTNRMGFQVVNF